ncbi:MAG TPA: hypothetical protein VGR28_05035 [Candidatus Thermoplasmatota archaeon]|jgi:hypothetical protein|nr:hypothetical protein [Candidatus Thermoplasmatota archaeon]
MRALFVASALAALLVGAGAVIAPGADDVTAVADAMSGEVDGFKDGVAQAVAPAGELGQIVVLLLDAIDDQAQAGAGAFLAIGQDLAGAGVRAVEVERAAAETCLGLVQGPDGLYDASGARADIACLEDI